MAAHPQHDLSSPKIVTPRRPKVKLASEETFIDTVGIEMLRLGSEMLSFPRIRVSSLVGVTSLIGVSSLTSVVGVVYWS